MEFEDFINDYQLKEIANLNKKKLSFDLYLHCTI